MSMTPEEFKEYTNKQYREKMEDKEVSYQEKYDFLTSHGWEQIDYKNDDWKGVFWNRKGSNNSSMGMSIDPAYALALLENPNEEDKGLVEYCKTRETGDYSREFPCNKCGGDIRKPDEPNSDGKMFYWGYYGEEVEYRGGYASDPLEDTITYRFILCEQCLHDLMLSFKIPPKINTYMP